MVMQRSSKEQKDICSLEKCNLISIRRLVYRITSRAFGILPISGIPVLLYHRVGVEDYKSGVSGVNIANFSAHMDFLCKNNYYFASLDEIVKYVKGEINLPKRTVALTFDDGFEDNYLYAFPVLKKKNIRATVFLNTAFVGRRLSGGEAFGSVDTKRKNAVYQFLSWDQIREMNNNGIDFQPHTHTHPDLTCLENYAVEREILLSKSILEEKLGKKANHFSYPLGKYNDNIIRILGELDFVSAWAVRPYNVKEGMNLFTLSRKSPGNSLDEFRTILSDYYKLRRYFKK